MKKSIFEAILLLILASLALTLCACGGRAGTENMGKLVLDYEAAAEQAETDAQASVGATTGFQFEEGKDRPTSGNSSSSDGEEIGMAAVYAIGTSEREQEQAGKTSDEPQQQSSGRPQQNQSQSTEQQPSAQSGGDVQSEQPQEQTQEKKQTVTITIRCDTAVNNGMHQESKWTGIVPASGCILPVTEVEIADGQTVFDVLAAVCDKYKIHMSYRGGTSSGCYVDGINNLYEFDGGRWSGWMYCVNDWYPNYGCGVYFVKAGDVIEWNYTCDLGLDLDGSWWEGAQEWKDTHD